MRQLPRKVVGDMARMLLMIRTRDEEIARLLNTACACPDGQHGSICLTFRLTTRAETAEVRVAQLETEIAAWEHTAKFYDRMEEAMEAIKLRLHGPSHFLGNEISVIVHAALESK